MEIPAIIEAVQEAKEDYTEDDIIDGLDIMQVKGNTITLDQFIDLMFCLKDPATVEDAFRFFDKDGKGAIEEETFRTMLRKYAPELKGKEIEEIIEKANASNNGKLNYAAFVDYWAKA